MGMVASQNRFLSLTARSNDLELQVQQLNQKRMILADSTLDVFNNIVTLSPPVPSDYLIINPNTGEQEVDTIAYQAAQNAFDAQYAQYNAQQVHFNAQDTKIELQINNLDTQHKAVQTEIESVKKIISKNIESTYKTFA